MGDSTAPAPRERGWTRVLIALAGFLVVPQTPLVRAVLPIDNTLLLLVPALAACFLAGWAAGGSSVQAVVWVVLAMWVLSSPTPGSGSSAFDDLSRSWSLLSAAAFGVVCALGSGRTFLGRALAATGLGLLLGLVIALVEHVSPGRPQAVFAQQFMVRNAESAAVWQAMSHSLVLRFPSARAALMQAMTDELALAQRWSAVAPVFFPALLALESLVSFAIAWALYHRLSRVRLGAALAPLREFRFNDQLIWGLVAGLVLVLLPSLSPLSTVGKSLLLFFGTLYALRGIAIVAWSATYGPPVVAAVVAVAYVLLRFLPLIDYPAASLSLGVGLGDTWFNWRSRAGKEPRSRHPGA